MLREAAWGRANWADACRLLAEALPDTAAAIVNHDMPAAGVGAAFAHGIEPSFMESYRSRYAALNPWLDFWAMAPAGQVRISERDSPAAAFSDTAFYNEWLAPQANMDAAVGMRVDVDAGNAVLVSWHYDVAAAPGYDDIAARILERLAPRLVEGVQGAAALREGLEAGQRFGSLMESVDGAALLVERDRRVRETNGEAAAALGAGQVITAPGGMLEMRQPAAQRWLEETVARLADGLPVPSATMAFSLDDHVYGISATRAPDYTESGFALLVRPRPRVLVVVRLLAGSSVRVLAAALRVAYGLSAAEIRLCEMLLNGRSLAEAAQMLGVSDGTVRQRVKMIFHKTGTHRQGELVALLARFGAGGRLAGDVEN